MNLFGIRLLGVSSETGHKLLLTLAVIAAILVLRAVVWRAFRAISAHVPNDRAAFWTRQGLSVATALIVLLAILSIWFDNPTRLATGAGLVTAGLAVALQRAVLSVAGYVVILRGKTFTVGDRIQMGGVRGDVIALGFMQTRILEMGEPPSVQDADPAMWVKSRQFTGRIVTVTNDKVFDEPVYNFTREFPFIWEEMTVPIAYRDDRHLAEQILLRCTREVTERFNKASQEERRSIEARYGVTLDDLAPHVYWRLTDNWLELTVRFIVREHGVRAVKDGITRRVLQELDAAHIGIASATFEVVGVPPLRIEPAATQEPR